MDPIKIDVSIIARDLKLAPQNVEAALNLLDQGNTIPFVTRFRKDLTGGLNENQLLEVNKRAAKLRALAERKATILRAIESQNGLTDDIRKQIEKTTSSRRLEDLYLPFKTKKQTKAAVARQQGLLPLANEILESKTTDADLATRATEFVRVDKGLDSVDAVIKGVSDLISESLAENETLRASLRTLFRDTAKLSSRLIKVDPPASQADATKSEEKSAAQDPAVVKADAPETTPAQTAPDTSETKSEQIATTVATNVTPADSAPASPASETTTAETPATADATTTSTEEPSNEPPATDTSAATAKPVAPADSEAPDAAATTTTQSMPAATNEPAPAKKKKKLSLIHI